MINSPLIITKEERLKQSQHCKDISLQGLLHFTRNDEWPKKSLQNFAGFLVVLKQSIIAQ